MKRTFLGESSPWVLAVALSALAGAATAQTSPASTDPVTNVDEIVVTGSLIRGSRENAISSVDVIGAEELQRQGSPSVVELLKALPVSNGVLGDTNQFDSRAQASEGTGSVNLRGLGPTRTLVLLNGRRMVTNPLAVGGAGVVDTNMIPSAAIGRIEILKEGAAATYGSDAIAGVVNFITRENFDGLEFSGDYRFVPDTEGDWSAAINWGWNGERADIFLSAGYQHRSELDAIDRDFTQSTYLQNPEGGYSAANNPGTFLTYVAPSAAGARLFRDPQCTALGGFAGFSGTTPACYGQYIDYDNLVEEEDRFQLFGSLDVDLAENHSFRAEFTYGHTDVPHWETTPSYAILSSPSAEAQGAGALQALYNNRFFIPSSNPGLINFVAQNPSFSNLLTFGAAYLAPAARPLFLGGNPLTGGGASVGFREFDHYRAVASFSGDLPFGSNLHYDISATYAQETGTRSAPETLTNRFALALRGLGGPACDTAPNTPGIQGPGGGAAVAGANGCLYFNPFSNAIASNAIDGQVNPQYNAAVANSVELIDWFTEDSSAKATMNLFVADAIVSGDLGVTLPGGPAQFAVGVQFRRDIYNSTYNDLTNKLITPCTASPDFFNDACTGAQANGPFTFGGVNIPGILDRNVYSAFTEFQLPFTDTFEVQVAARYEDYGGDTGSTFDPKISALWRVGNGLSLRGGVGSTFRGPPSVQTSSRAGVSLQSILGTFRAVEQAGDPGLQPESAITYSAGAVFERGGFRGSIDYYRFDLKDGIVAEPVGGMVDILFPNGATGANRCGDPTLAALQARFQFTGACSAANLTRLLTRFINGSDVTTSGVDLMGSYELEDVWGGTFTIGGSATYVIEYYTEAQSVEGIVVAPAFEAVGNLNYQRNAYPLPEIKGQVYAQFENGDHNLRLTVNYVDGYEDNRTSPFATGAYRNELNAPVTVLAGQHIDAWVTANATYRLELPQDLTLTASVENITDEDPPFARLDLSYDPFTASGLGRTFKLGVRKRF